MMDKLQNRITEVLRNNPETKNLTIEALNNNGVITLTGVVSGREKSKLAEQLIGQQADVSAVINQIQVESHGGKNGVALPNVNPNQPSILIDKNS
jgi:osmotically-inducible protein OsmY